MKLYKIGLESGYDFGNRYAVSKNGQVYSYNSNKFLKGSSDGRRGYLKVKLYDVNRHVINVSIHRAVKLTIDRLSFKTKMTVDHLDDNKLNNKYSNLDICTNLENIRRSIDRKSSPSRAIQLSEEMVHQICNLLFNKGMTVAETSKKLSVSGDAVRKIYAGKNYKRISKDYI